jgi:hypothetical protein
MAATHDLIQTHRLSATQNTITFSSIPQTYTDLRFLISARGTRTGSVRTYINVYINGTSTNSQAARIIAYSTNLTLADYAAGTDYAVMTAADAAANTFGMTELYMANYTNTTEHKSSLVSGAALAEVSSEHMIGLWGAYKTVNNAITSVSFVPDTGDFAANTVISLYGIKNS